MAEKPKKNKYKELRDGLDKIRESFLVHKDNERALKELHEFTTKNGIKLQKGVKPGLPPIRTRSFEQYLESFKKNLGYVSIKSDKTVTPESLYRVDETPVLNEDETAAGKSVSSDFEVNEEADSEHFDALKEQEKTDRKVEEDLTDLFEDDDLRTNLEESEGQKTEEEPEVKIPGVTKEKGRPEESAEEKEPEDKSTTGGISISKEQTRQSGKFIQETVVRYPRTPWSLIKNTPPKLPVSRLDVPESMFDRMMRGIGATTAIQDVTPKAPTLVDYLKSPDIVQHRIKKYQELVEHPEFKAHKQGLIDQMTSEREEARPQYEEGNILSSNLATRELQVSRVSNPVNNYLRRKMKSDEEIERVAHNQTIEHFKTKEGFEDYFDLPEEPLENKRAAAVDSTRTPQVLPPIHTSGTSVAKVTAKDLDLENDDEHKELLNKVQLAADALPKTGQINAGKEVHDKSHPEYAQRLKELNQARGKVKTYIDAKIRELNKQVPTSNIPESTNIPVPGEGNPLPVYHDYIHSMEHYRNQKDYKNASAYKALATALDSKYGITGGDVDIPSPCATESCLNTYHIPSEQQLRHLVGTVSEAGVFQRGYEKEATGLCDTCAAEEHKIKSQGDNIDVERELDKRARERHSAEFGYDVAKGGRTPVAAGGSTNRSGRGIREDVAAPIPSGRSIEQSGSVRRKGSDALTNYFAERAAGTSEIQPDVKAVTSDISNSMLVLNTRTTKPRRAQVNAFQSGAGKYRLLPGQTSRPATLEETFELRSSPLPEGAQLVIESQNKPAQTVVQDDGTEVPRGTPVQKPETPEQKANREKTRGRVDIFNYNLTGNDDVI